MPAFIKNKKDENKWQKAKKAVSESKKKDQDSFSDRNWALVNHIYQTINKSKNTETEELSKIDLLIRALKKAKQKLSSEDEYENEELTNNQQPDWLKENDPSYEEYTDDEDEDAHRKQIAEDIGGEEVGQDIGGGEIEQDKSRGFLSKFHQPSKEELRDMRAHSIPHARFNKEYKILKANPKKNPQLATEAEIIEARNKHNASKKEAYNKLQQAPEWQNADMLTRIKMDHDFEQKWNEDNPNHGLEAMKAHNDAHKKGLEHKKAAAADKQAKLDEIKYGGLIDPNAMSTEEGLQNAGGVRDDNDNISGVNIQANPLSAFAARNAKMLAEQRQKEENQKKQLSPEEARKEYAKKILQPNKDEGEEYTINEKDAKNILGKAPKLDPSYNQFLEHYYPIIKRNIKKLSNDPTYKNVPVQDWDDLHEAGMHGLIHAINTYHHDHPKQKTFAQFANSSINGLMRTHLKSLDEVPEIARKKEKQFRRAQAPASKVAPEAIPSMSSALADKIKAAKTTESAPQPQPIKQPAQQQQAAPSIESPKQEPQQPKQGQTQTLLETSNHPNASDMSDRLKRVEAQRTQPKIVKRGAGTVPLKPIHIDEDIATGQAED